MSAEVKDGDVVQEIKDQWVILHWDDQKKTRVEPKGKTHVLVEVRG